MNVKFMRPNLTRILRYFTTAADNDIVPSGSSLSISKNQENALTKYEKPEMKPMRIDISEVSKILRPGAISSMYVNKSEILQQLVKLGVKLYVLEKDPEATKFILSLKFDDIKDIIIFLSELEIKIEEIGNLITRNPFLLRESLDDLKVRINYLKYKKFTDEMITRIVSNNPRWLTHSTQEIDSRLGFFQNNYSLTGNEVRFLATKCPKLITYSLEKIKLNNFSFKEEMGFTPEEIKKILLDKPKLFRNGQRKLLQAFEYLHNTMKIPLEMIVESSEILSCREMRLKERHIFLVKLGKDQYNPKKPNYVALTTLVSGTDSYFSTEVAHSSVQIYNDYLKSL